MKPHTYSARQIASLFEVEVSTIHRVAHEFPKVFGERTQVQDGNRPILTSYYDGATVDSLLSRVRQVAEPGERLTSALRRLLDPETHEKNKRERAKNNGAPRNPNTSRGAYIRKSDLLSSLEALQKGQDQILSILSKLL